MGKGKIKSIKGIDKGSIITRNGKEHNFIQPKLDSLYVTENYEIEFELFTLENGEKIASNFKPIRSGLISKISKVDDGLYIGFVTDSITKSEYSFKSAFEKNTIPNDGVTVQFELVIGSDCKPFAINIIN